MHTSLQKLYTIFKRTNEKTLIQLKTAMFSLRIENEIEKIRRRQHDFLPFHPVGSIDNDENTWARRARRLSRFFCTKPNGTDVVIVSSFVVQI